MAEFITRINHIGVVVFDADQIARQLEKSLGLRVHRVETYGEGQLKLVFLRIGETDLELIEPLRPDSDAAAYLADHGPGIQHLALEVKELGSAMQQVKQSGVALADEQPRAGAAGTRIAFLRPESLGGLMLELCETVDDH